RAFAVWAFDGDAAVDRVCAEECEQHEDQSGDGRERTGGEEGDARLITERREIVHASQTHHLPPSMRPMACVRRLLMRPFRQFSRTFIQPTLERAEPLFARGG